MMPFRRPPKARIPRDPRRLARLPLFLLLGAYLAILLLPTPGFLVDRGYHSPLASVDRLRYVWPAVVATWLLLFGVLYAYGMARLHTLDLLTPRGRRLVLIAPPVLALGLALLLDWRLFGYVWLGLGVQVSWGLAWSESTHVFLPGGKLRRGVWAVLGMLAPPALIIGVPNTGMVVFALLEIESLLIVPALRGIVCLVILLAVIVRSIRARRAARRWVEATYGTPSPI